MLLCLPRGAPGGTGGKLPVSCRALVFAAPRYQVIKKGVGHPPDFGLSNQGLFLAEMLIISTYFSGQMAL